MEQSDLCSAARFRMRLERDDAPGLADELGQERACRSPRARRRRRTSIPVGRVSRRPPEPRAVYEASRRMSRPRIARTSPDPIGVHPRPARDSREDLALEAVVALHQHPVAPAARPLEPDLRAPRAGRGRSRCPSCSRSGSGTGRAARSPLDARVPQKPQVEVVVGGVDVSARRARRRRSSSTAPEDDRRRRHVVADEEVEAPVERQRAVRAPARAPPRP